MDFETHLLDPRLLVPVMKTTWQDYVCECERWNPTLPYAQAKMCPSGNTETSHPSSQPSRLSRLDDLLCQITRIAAMHPIEPISPLAALTLPSHIRLTTTGNFEQKHFSGTRYQIQTSFSSCPSFPPHVSPVWQ